MRLGKQILITLKPKQPYLDWANTLDDGPKIDPETSLAKLQQMLFHQAKNKHI